MLISIITSTYNSENFLEEALVSYKNQTHQNKELIIIDGLSKDNTLGIINQYQNLYNVFISEKDKGIYDALNKGIEKSSGDIIGILHSDDLFYDEDVLSEVNKIFENDLSIQAVYGDLHYVNRNNTDKIVRKWDSGKFNLRKLSLGWMPPHPALFIRKQCFEDFGNYDLRYKSAADYDLILRFLFKHKIKTVYLPKIISKMRVGGISNQSIKHRLRANKEDRTAMKVNGIKFPIAIAVIKPFRKVFQYIK